MVGVRERIVGGLMGGGRELGQVGPPLRSLSGSSGCCPWRVRGGRGLDLGSKDGGGKIAGVWEFGVFDVLFGPVGWVWVWFWSPGGGGVACWVDFLGSYGAWSAHSSTWLGKTERGGAGNSEAMVASSWEMALVAVVAELSRQPSVVWGSNSEL